MTELKTDKKELERASKVFFRPARNEGQTFRKNLFHDALHAHTLEARIDKGVEQIQKIISVVEAGTFDLSAGEETALLYDLRSTKAILGGE